MGAKGRSELNLRVAPLAFLAIALACLPACRKGPFEPQATTETPAPRAELWKEFSGDSAFRHVQELVDFGPRPAGSTALEQSRGYIISELNKVGWHVIRQSFSDKTPKGSIEFVNLIARFGPEHDPASEAPPPLRQRFIVGSHYDTKLYATIQFVGANDGGSSTGALLELARVLALDAGTAAQVELVCFDGEEAFAQFSATDGLYGSRFYAQNLRETGRRKAFEAALVLDMVGDKNLTITLPPDSPPALAKTIFAAADALGTRRHFSFSKHPILDDHVPIQQAGIPAIDIIDFDYVPWHTADDTMEQLSPASLQIVGQVTVYALVDLVRKGL